MIIIFDSWWKCYCLHHLGQYTGNAEFQLEGVPAVLNRVKYFCCPELYPDVTFTVIVKRRSLFYMCNLVFPMGILGILTLLSFLLPAESGIFRIFIEDWWSINHIALLTPFLSAYILWILSSLMQCKGCTFLLRSKPDIAHVSAY